MPAGGAGGIVPTRSVIFGCLGAVAASVAVDPGSDVLTLFLGFCGCGGAFGSFGLRPGFLRGSPFAVKFDVVAP